MYLPVGRIGPLTRAIWKIWLHSSSIQAMPDMTTPLSRSVAFGSWFLPAAEDLRSWTILAGSQRVKKDEHYARLEIMPGIGHPHHLWHLRTAFAQRTRIDSGRGCLQRSRSAAIVP